MVISPNSIVVGLTPGDYLAGFASIVIDCLVSFIASKIGGALGERMAKAIASVLMRKAAEQIAKELGEQSAKEILKDIVENVAERPIMQGVAGLVEKLFGVIVDKVQDAAGTGEKLTRPFMMPPMAHNRLPRRPHQINPMR